MLEFRSDFLAVARGNCHLDFQRGNDSHEWRLAKAKWAHFGLCKIW